MELNIITEALRFLGTHGEADDALRQQMTVLAQELQNRIKPRSVWRLANPAALSLPGQLASGMLTDCTQAAVLVCTLGAAFDQWVKQLQARDMSRAVILDALGSAYAEAACDAAEEAIRTRFPGMYLTDRFSPGYGDLPLDVQPELAAFAGAARIGVTVTESLLMNPQKSVTAIVGIADKPQPARIRGCAFCTLNNTCPYRKVGTTCHV